jgi:hypothetical protein
MVSDPSPAPMSSARPDYAGEQGRVCWVSATTDRRPAPAHTAPRPPPKGPVRVHAVEVTEMRMVTVVSPSSLP